MVKSTTSRICVRTLSVAATGSGPGATSRSPSTLYEDHGADFVRHLNGQFAVALYDGRRHSLLLARDHVGIAPLFYTWIESGVGRALLFASEIKSLLAHPEVRRGVNLTGPRPDPDFPRA